MNSTAVFFVYLVLHSIHLYIKQQARIFIYHTEIKSYVKTTFSLDRHKNETSNTTYLRSVPSCSAHATLECYHMVSNVLHEHLEVAVMWPWSLLVTSQWGNKNHVSSLINVSIKMPILLHSFLFCTAFLQHSVLSLLYALNRDVCQIWNNDNQKGNCSS